MATIVLAHGAWSAAWAWKRMRVPLASLGHEFVSPTYTGLGERAHLCDPSIDLETHIEDVLAVIRVEDLCDVVLVGHSYGGMVATGVADRARDRIRQLIYLDAFVPRDGESLSDLLSEEQRQHMKEGTRAGDGWRVPPNPTPSDTSEQDKAWIATRRLPQPIRCMETPLKLRHGELTLPRSFILCTRNRGNLVRFHDRAKHQPGWRTYEIDASHSPNVTAPEALASLLDRVIHDEPGTGARP